MAAAAYGQLNLEESPSWGSRSVDCFEKLEQIGEGTYGLFHLTPPRSPSSCSQVYRAREIQTGEIVALKKIRMDNEKEGFPITAIREIKILKKLHHDNVIQLKEIVTSPGPEVDEHGKSDGSKYKGSIYMVFEYMDHDLTGLADRPGLRFSIPQIKWYMKQLLTGLHYCHVNQVLHRDIKGRCWIKIYFLTYKFRSSNLLIDNEGNLKLADFGLARSFSNDHNGNLTNRVITLWYRPPELLLGATKYGPAVDMWSVGCIFAELLQGKPVLTGKNEPEQLNKIYELCGSPDEINWPGVSGIPWYNKFKPTRQMKRRVKEVFRHFDHHALDLLEKMLTLDPSQTSLGFGLNSVITLLHGLYSVPVDRERKDQRISAKDALDAEYFWIDPLPCDPKTLPKYESSHEFQTKKKRQQQRQNEEMAKRQKLQHPQQHSRLPPIQQTGQAHPPQWAGPNHPMNSSQPPLSSGPSHHQYGKPRGPGGPNRYPPSANPSGGYYPDRGGQGGGFSGGPYPPQGRAPPGASGGYGAGPSNYPQGGQYGGFSAARGPNPMAESSFQTTIGSDFDAHSLPPIIVFGQLSLVQEGAIRYWIGQNLICKRCLDHWLLTTRMMHISSCKCFFSKEQFSKRWFRPGGDGAIFYCSTDFVPV
ncbi:hypothetical protein RJ639_020719 [Escallonia herrerae]|uniref:Protein kinase domain-containing protein n=1 Tax=Escallonia herrerae TaxID=1293975 RepID=A0AA88V3Q6_9ASTE|nr:hypothetical protein RJ639_020719 [Escallonia herrerae]